jgi:dihydrofolate reductase
MTKVIADISMSLDGFVTGPDPDLAHGLGVGGEPLHYWAMNSSDDIDAQVLREAAEATGAVVMGRNLFDFVDGANGWNDALGYGAELAVTPPFFVVTHSAPASVRLSLGFTFVTDGLEEAIGQARAAAGTKDVFVMGGGDVVRQCVDSGLANELRIHLAPVLLGSGTPLFDGAIRSQLVQKSVRSTSTATHLIYGLNH